MAAENEDTLMRMAAFAHLRRLSETRDYLTSEDISAGFIYGGRRVPLVNPQRGIFKPQSMQYLLSIRTVFPAAGRRIWYDDQRTVHQQIFNEEESVEYAFMGQDPEAADNRYLKAAFENQVPVIYFLGIAPKKYQAIVPVYISAWQPHNLRVRVAFGVVERNECKAPADAPDRRYALREVKQRLHQASFREAVMEAYSGRCALSGLPETMLLDAAHIVADMDERLGQPVVPNGLPLSKIHHAAFDSHLIGIDPDFKIHVSARLLNQKDGPMLEALKLLDKRSIHLPNREKDRPDRERLEVRFLQFKEHAA